MNGSETSTYSSSKNIKINIKVLFISIILSLLIAEGTMRGYYAFTGKAIGTDAWEICLRETIRTVSNEANPARFSPDWYAHEYWNYSGIRPKANYANDIEVSFEDGGKIIIFDEHTNAQHTRNLRNFSIKKQQNVSRIIVLGDSFTWGDEVPLQFSYPYILERLIPNSEVMNMGIRATGIDNMYLRWKYDALQYRPDIVIYTIYIGDISRARPCIYKPKFDIVNNSLHISNFPPPTLQNISLNHHAPLIESYFIKHLIFSVKHNEGIARSNYFYGLERLNYFLDDMQTTSKNEGTYFLVVLITDSPHFNFTSKRDADLWSEVVERTKIMLEAKSIPYVDSKELFYEQNYDLHSEENIPSLYQNNQLTHFTPSGNGYLAQGIQRKLEEQSVIDPQPDYEFIWVRQEYRLYLKNKVNASNSKLILAYKYLD